MDAFTPDRLVTVCAERYTQDELQGFAADALAKDKPVTVFLAALEYQHLMAARIALTKFSSPEMVNDAHDMERRGYGGQAWILREAVAIRIVDHPNERREVDVGGVVQG
ncbi:hypothetical protein G7068_13635 [Leucobacter viscericola]|uniref:Uncharacterized protein n=1 Tax=Leucobacter viscericola TaxID=2714935 RepID=A0A6G7XHN8_9MICO|nr:hypothetical protein [Leucobacter viscericola]QIK64120.1 hypothetical protein G7068_13635 [Leucobacter viscericola]